MELEHRSSKAVVFGSSPNTDVYGSVLKLVKRSVLKTDRSVRIGIGVRIPSLPLLNFAMKGLRK